MWTCLKKNSSEMSRWVRRSIGTRDNLVGEHRSVCGALCSNVLDGDKPGSDEYDAA